MSDWQLTKGKFSFIIGGLQPKNSFKVVIVLLALRLSNVWSFPDIWYWPIQGLASVIFHPQFLHHYRLTGEQKTLIFTSIQNCMVIRCSEKFKLLFRILLKIPVIRSWILGAKSLQSFLEISQEHTRIFQPDRKTNQIDLRQTFFWKFQPTVQILKLQS